MFHHLSRAAIALCAVVALSACTTAGGGAGTDAVQSLSASRSDAQLVDDLRAALPDATVTDVTPPVNAQTDEPSSPQSRSPQSRSLDVRVETAAGAALVSLSLHRVHSPISDRYSQCPDSAYYPYSECTVETLHDGVALVRDESPATAEDPAGGRRWTALLSHSDGRLISASAVNAPRGDETVPLEPVPLEPVLGLEQLSAIVELTAWNYDLHNLVDATSEPAPAAADFEPIAFDSINDTLEALLPDRLTVADAGGSDGFGHVSVDDGLGASLVTVSAQRWSAGDAAVVALFEESERLLDGGYLSITQEPSQNGGNGAVEWSVDSLTPDGLRVFVSAVNARAYTLDAARSEPALSLDELRAIASDPSWRALAAQ